MDVSKSDIFNPAFNPAKTSLADWAACGDPIQQWSFEVILGRKSVMEVTRVKATEKVLAVTFVVTEGLTLQDWSSERADGFGVATVRLHQKQAAAAGTSKYIDLSYKLTKLKATTFDFDAAGLGFGLNSIMHVTQIYNYDGLTVVSSK